MQKVTLIFAVVQAFEQFVQPCRLIQANARVVAGGNFVGAHLHGVV